MHKLCESWGVVQKLATAYHPQTNLTERVNKVLKTMIASYVGKHHQDWDKWLPAPALLALGRNITGPLERLIHKTPIPDTTVYNTLQKQQEIQEEVRRHIGVAKSRQARYYNARRRDVHFEVGDLVWVRAHPLSKAESKFSAKLAPRWLGPVKVEKRLGPITYRICGVLSDGKSDTVNVANLKPFFGLVKP